jgi:hypothetical protein
MLNDKITTIGTAGIGSLLVAGTDAVATATIPSPDEISTLGQLLIQLAIGIATIWRIVKKPKNK